VARFDVVFDTEIAPIRVDSADTLDQAQAIADDWNERHGTTDPKFADHATVRTTT
jgi:hypothetical protein